MNTGLNKEKRNMGRGINLKSGDRVCTRKYLGQTKPPWERGIWTIPLSLLGSEWVTDVSGANTLGRRTGGKREPSRYLPACEESSENAALRGAPLRLRLQPLATQGGETGSAPAASSTSVDLHPGTRRCMPAAEPSALPGLQSLFSHGAGGEVSQTRRWGARGWRGRR